MHSKLFRRDYCYQKIKKYCTNEVFSNNLHGKEVVETFYEKELQKTNQTVFRVKNEIKKTGDKLDFKWKDNTICSIAGMIKMMLLYKISYYPVVQNEIVKLEAK